MEDRSGPIASVEAYPTKRSQVEAWGGSLLHLSSDVGYVGPLNVAQSCDGLSVGMPRDRL
jgi:hypothetical protein